jgi:DNA-binding NtrC family response regulator
LAPYSEDHLNRTVLLVDDEAEVLAVLEGLGDGLGWQVQHATGHVAALALYEQDRPDVVLLAIGLPGTSGLQFLQQLRSRDADAAVVMLAQQADVGTAVEAMRLGAENFLTKPIDPVHAEATVERACEKAALRRRTRFLARLQTGDPGTDSLGQSALMRELARQVALLASSSTTALLTGEAGTGKGYIALLLHTLSPRARGPFVNIHCAGGSPPFLESEIFGHERGTSNGAREQKRGLVEVADSGTFFVDEVGDLSLELQSRLLELLDGRRFRRIGGTRDIEVDVRLVVATRHDLAASVSEGRFREDLYQRLSGRSLRIPPLRERGRDDIADLAMRLLAELSRRFGHGPVRLHPDALARITEHAWPGNIREMHNVIERALLLSGGAGEIGPALLPPEIASSGNASVTSGADLSLEDVERRHIAVVIEHHGGNRSRAARTLGISRATLYDKLARYGLDQVGRTPRGPRSR